MIGFGSLPPDDAKNNWRSQLDQFVKANEKELAALAWGLSLEWGDRNDILGIDLKPKPHFVACSREAIETLNRQVNHRLQEILGILDGYKPEEEVAIIGIGDGQIKLINFQPKLPPPECFEQIEEDIDTLIKQLEERMNQQLELTGNLG